ncbi:MAG TPA: TfoX/Sxy family DNA transformation protein [Blastocatellia bacterium]|nr:TfoX/Sxy family DNA transformation protein [Blastocatellia bacterium]HMV86745.1 TfoX/Sxy family DNA transformation protein [Blastocatellia bacterium]HMX28233.1 TfoX/Sxy family DNA transformation protein [Blastocatellia bacterium]HNG32219.1 TfoX/Sxy family DNA transformation protein [Blastocatellia bacterium]
MTKSRSDLKNIGPTSEQWLRAVGIQSREDLERIGSVEAFRLVKAHGFNAGLNLLYALEAALLEVHWTALSPQTKTKLKAAAKKVKE